MESVQRPIGIFDSGIGGLTVLKEINRILPSENLIYLGDTARVPYGTRSPDTVIRYSFECTDFLLKKGVKILVVACNTVSAISLPEIRKRLSIPVLGVIGPGSRAAARATKNRQVGVIGTEATIRSSAYVKAIQAQDERITVSALACPLFVPLVEEGWTEGEVARLVVEKYLSAMEGKGIDTLVLGCTHYPLLKDVIQTVMKGVTLIDSAIETARMVKDILAGTGMLNSAGSGNKRFFVTDGPEKFVDVGQRFLGQEIKEIEKISL
ncbi:MAG: glutamate racemase [Nitrospirales bacterium]|nr:glutamate racemase [Nitrospirales bacterium]